MQIIGEQRGFPETRGRGDDDDAAGTLPLHPRGQVRTGQPFGVLPGQQKLGLKEGWYSHGMFCKEFANPFRRIINWVKPLLIRVVLTGKELSCVEVVPL